MSITVSALIAKDKEIDAATIKILNIYRKLDDRTRLFVMAQVNQTMNHSFEQLAERHDHENYLKYTGEE